jgi:hypothetical protein
LIHNEPDGPDSVHRSRMSSLTKSVSIPTIDNGRLHGVHVARVSRIAKTSEERNPSIQPSNHQTIDQNTVIPEKFTTPIYSTVTVCSVNRLSKSTEINNNQHTNAFTSRHENNKNASGPLTQVNVIRLSKNKISMSCNIPTNNVSKLGDNLERGVSDTTNAKDFGNSVPPDRTITVRDNNSPVKLQEDTVSSTQNTRIIRVKLNNIEKQTGSNVRPSNTDDDSTVLRRTSSFGGVTITKVKRVVD